MKKQINNFCKNNPIEISAAQHSKFGALVTITQSSGSMRFQHDMTRKQALQMAAALVEMADSFDEVAA